MFIWGGGRVLNYSLVKVHTEKIVYYPSFPTLKPSHPFGKPELEFYLQLTNLSLISFSLMKSDICFTVHIGSITEPGLMGHVGKGGSHLPPCRG